MEKKTSLQFVRFVYSFVVQCASFDVFDDVLDNIYIYFLILTMTILVINTSKVTTKQRIFTVLIRIILYIQ